jgi:FO synthase
VQSRAHAKSRVEAALLDGQEPAWQRRSLHMTPGLDHVLSRAAEGPLSEGEALSLATLGHMDVPALCEAAATRRKRAHGTTLTFSPKVFLPLTNLCRNYCDYCSFRKSPGDDGAWTMSDAEIRTWLERGREQGAIEALFCLGDKPETAFAAYRKLLAERGHRSTVDLIERASHVALELGLLPHTNAGVLTRADMARLRPVTVSMGLMLENISARLCEKGMPHHRARDKRPQVRVQMTREAGELAIPFTSGILLGIGETREERVHSLLAIRALHHEHGHIQEVIVQNFRTKPEIPMASAPEPDDFEVAHSVALARLILPDDVSVQAPPNLNPHATALLIAAGINDFGGISPVTPDYINPGHPWPHLERLFELCEREGFSLVPRLPLYERYRNAHFLDAALEAPVAAQHARIQSVSHPRELALGTARTAQPRPLLHKRASMADATEPTGVP